MVDNLPSSDNYDQIIKQRAILENLFKRLTSTLTEYKAYLLTSSIQNSPDNLKYGQTLKNLLVQYDQVYAKLSTLISEHPSLKSGREITPYNTFDHEQFATKMGYKIGEVHVSHLNNLDSLDVHNKINTLLNGGKKESEDKPIRKRNSGHTKDLTELEFFRKAPIVFQYDSTGSNHNIDEIPIKDDPGKIRKRKPRGSNESDA